MSIISFEIVLRLNSSPGELARRLLFTTLLLLHYTHVYLKAREDLSLLAQGQKKREYLSLCLACVHQSWGYDQPFSQYSSREL